MKYKLFIIYVFCIVIGVFLLDCFAGYAFSFLERKAFEINPMRFEVRQFYAIERAESEIDIIGASDASHSYISQIIEDSLHMSTFNYGKDGCFFIYQNCLINMMLGSHTPKMIIWEIEKDCLQLSRERTKDEWQSIGDFYPFYDKNKYVKTVIDKKNRFQSLFMLSNLYRYNSKILEIIEPFMISEVCSDTKGYLPLPNCGYKYPTFQNNEIKADFWDDNKSSMLRKTLDLCHKRNVKVVFSYSPKYFKDNTANSIYYQKLSAIAKEFGVTQIDMVNSKSFVNDSTLFKDNYHLNDRGARLYMKYFIPKLKESLSI